MLGINNQHLDQSILLEESGNPLVIRIVVSFIMLLVVVFTIWASVAVVEEVAVAQGEIVPAGQIKPIQNAEAGRISEILIKNGDAVKAGQVLMRLDPLVTQTETAEHRADYDSLIKQQSRLQAFLRGKSAGDSRLENHLQQRPDQSREINHSIFVDKQKQQQASLAELDSRKIFLEKKHATFIEEYSMREQLLEKKLIPKLGFLDVKRKIADVESEIADIGTQRTRLLREMDETRTQALTELGNVDTELSKIKQQLTRAKNKEQMMEIKSPADGFVHGLKVFTVGGVVNRGDTILELVPSTKLHAEIHISARDVGHVKVGQKVKVRMTAYDFSRYGVVHGSLHEISPTAFIDKDGTPYHLGYVTLDHDYVGTVHGRNPVISGMTLQADIKTGSKTVLTYLLKPIYASAQQAMRER